MQSKYSRKVTDPTPEQIRERCEEIQAGWSRRIESIRRVIKQAPLEFQLINASEIEPSCSSRRIRRRSI